VSSTGAQKLRDVKREAKRQQEENRRRKKKRSRDKAWERQRLQDEEMQAARERAQREKELKQRRLESVQWSLDVPFKRVEKAKTLGARFDGYHKVWYASSPADYKRITAALPAWKGPWDPPAKKQAKPKQSAIAKADRSTKPKRPKLCSASGGRQPTISFPKPAL